MQTNFEQLKKYLTQTHPTHYAVELHFAGKRYPLLVEKRIFLGDFLKIIIARQNQDETLGLKDFTIWVGSREIRNIQKRRLADLPEAQSDTLIRITIQKKDIPLDQYQIVRLTEVLEEGSLGTPISIEITHFPALLGRNTSNRTGIYDLGDDISISRTHAEIIKEDGEYKIANRSGSQLEICETDEFASEQLPSPDEDGNVTFYQLSHGDRLRFGEVIFHFEIVS